MKFVQKFMWTCQVVICTFWVAGGADSNKGKSKKWKKILQFPHISQCIDQKNKLGKWNFT